MSYRKFSLSDWHKEHLKRVEDYADKVQLILYAAVAEVVRAVMQSKPDPEQPFSFEQYPQTRERVNSLLERASLYLLTTIRAGQAEQWGYADKQSDAMVDSVLKADPLRPESFAVAARYKMRNDAALTAFQNRRIGGLNLSDRVWRYQQQLRNELELALDIGILEGKSAAALSRDIRTYLNEPDKLFRKVRSKRGVLALSKAAKNYHPGQGVYRSSFKNAMRLTRTEINATYRESDHLRRQQLDFVVGVRVVRSHSQSTCDVCKALAGEYPKSFKFSGWHPQCRCHAISILATPEEMRELNRRVLAGEDTGGFVSDNQITEPPAGWDVWIEDNWQRFSKPGAVKPLFVVDNQAFVKAPLSVPIIRELTNVPHQLADYEKKMGVTVDRRVFSMLSKPVVLAMSNKEENFGYSPQLKYVQGYYARRYKKSKWKAETVIYHEYAHAIDQQQNLRISGSVKTLMAKYRNEYGESDNSEFRRIHNQLIGANNGATKRRDRDGMEKIGAARDALMALNSDYGYGHSKQYWQIPEMPEREFIAHAFENYFKGNEYFQQSMPGLYAQMQSMVSEWVKTLP